MNAKQVLGVLIVIFSVLAVSTAQLTDIFGGDIAKVIVSIAGLCNAIMGGLVTQFSGQASLVRDVAAMPGVEKITVNALANQTLAQVAVDPKTDKIAPTPTALDVVTKTAEGGK